MSETLRASLAIAIEASRLLDDALDALSFDKIRVWMSPGVIPMYVRPPGDWGLILPIQFPPVMTASRPRLPSLLFPFDSAIFSLLKYLLGRLICSLDAKGVFSLLLS